MKTVVRKHRGFESYLLRQNPTHESDGDPGKEIRRRNISYGEVAESAEGARLLSECTGKPVPRVRIPPSPPFCIQSGERMSWFSRLPVIALVALLAGAVGCDRREEQALVKPSAPVQRKLPEVIIPDEVQGQWKAVRIAVTDQDVGEREIYTVEIGSTFTVEDTHLTIEVLNFLPAFVMDGTMMTSASNKTSNPAAQIVIREEGEEVFRGWLFSLYPGVHSFKHSRYSFALVDFIPIEKKRVDKKS